MAVPIGKKYLLSEFQLEPDKLTLSRDGGPVHLTSKPFQVLLYLVEHRDRFVSRTELFDRFWQGKDVYDVALTRCVSAIRKALNDQADHPRFIETRAHLSVRADANGCGHMATSDALAQRLADVTFQARERAGCLDARIEEPMVHGADLHRDAM